MFLEVTRIGTVSSLAVGSGTPTSLILNLGSGLITVLAQKFTLLPERLLRKRPSFPLRRCVRVFKVRPERCLAGGIPLV